MCGKSGPTTNQTSSSSQSYAPTPEALAAYREILDRAQGVANTPFTGYSGELVAPLTAQQRTGIGNINSAASATQPWLQQGIDTVGNWLTTPLQQATQQYMSPFTQNVVDATQNQFANQNAQQQQGVLGNAISQGALGGNRVGVGQGILAGQQALAQAPVIAGLYDKGYSQAQNTALAMQQAGLVGLGALQSTGLQGAQAQVGAGSLEQQTQQAENQARQNQFMLQQAYPFQTTQWLAGLGTGVGSQMGGSSVGSGTQQTQQPAPSMFGQILGGGMGLAGLAGQAGVGSAIASAAPALLAMLARGGAVRGYAAGGVAGGDMTLPETPETLSAQQEDLRDGRRSVQMFPSGVQELELPEGRERLERDDGVYHYDPSQIGAGEIEEKASQERHNEFLGLGPFNKADVLPQVEAGEPPIAVVERRPDGTEVRAAIGTAKTAPQQIAFMERTKSPGNVVRVEHPLMTAQGRMNALGAAPGIASGTAPGVAPALNRDLGGAAVAGAPYAGVAGWVPQINIQPGDTRPNQQPMQFLKPGDQVDPIKQGMEALKAGREAEANLTPRPRVGAPLQLSPAGVALEMSQVGDPGLGGVSPGSLSEMPGSYGAVYARGGAVGLAAGGDVPRDEFGPIFTGYDELPPPRAAVDFPRPRSAVDAVPPPFPPPPEDTPEPVGVAVDIPLPRPRPDGISSGVPLPLPRPRGDALGVAAAAPDAGRSSEFSQPSPVPQSAYTQEILAAANQYGIPPGIAMGLVKRESNFNQNAISPAGAIGLMQLMPGTARDLGIDPRDVNQNIHGGMRYLSEQFKKYGNWDMALAAYNAGPGRVDRVLAGNGVLPSETRNYVPAVMASAREGGVGLTGASGVQPDPTGAAFSPPFSAPTSASRPAAAPPSAAGVAGPDFSSNSNLWPALTAAGFTMMSSRSPYAGVAVGEGGLAGMQTYSNLRENQQKNTLAVRKLQQDADRWAAQHGLGERRLQQDELKSTLQYGLDREKHELEREKSQQARYQRIEIKKDIYGNPISGLMDSKTGTTWWVNPDTNKMEMLGSPTQMPPDAVAPGPRAQGPAPAPMLPTPAAPATRSVDVPSSPLDAARQPGRVRLAASDITDMSIPVMPDGTPNVMPESILPGEAAVWRGQGVGPLNVQVLQENDRPSHAMPGVSDAEVIKGITEGRIKLDSRVYNSQYGRYLLGQATKYDPTFDQTNYNARQNLRNQFLGGGMASRSIRSSNQVMQHVGEHEEAIRHLAKFHSTGMPVIGPTATNRTIHEWYMRGGAGEEAKLQYQKSLADYDKSGQAIASELAKAFQGSGAVALESIRAWKSGLDPLASPVTQLSSVAASIRLLSGGIEALGNEWNRGMGPASQRDPYSWMSPKSRDLFDKIYKSDAVETYKEILKENEKKSGAAPAPGPAGAAPTPTKPTLQQFLDAARRANPGASEQALTDFYNKKYGGP